MVIIKHSVAFNWLVPYLPPANEVSEGCVFTGVCLSTGGGLPIAWWDTTPPGRHLHLAGTLSGRHPSGRYSPWPDTPRQVHPLASVGVPGMYVETLFFHTVGPNRNILFLTPSFCGHLLSHIELFNIDLRWCWHFWKAPITAHPLCLVMLLLTVNWRSERKGSACASLYLEFCVSPTSKNKPQMFWSSVLKAGLQAWIYHVSNFENLHERNAELLKLFQGKT